MYRRLNQSMRGKSFVEQLQVIDKELKAQAVYNNKRICAFGASISDYGFSVNPNRYDTPCEICDNFGCEHNIKKLFAKQA